VTEFGSGKDPTGVGVERTDVVTVEPSFDDVLESDERVSDSVFVEAAAEELSGRADEGDTFFEFLRARGFADNEDSCVCWTGAEDIVLEFF